METMRLLSFDVFRPLSSEQVKKRYEAIEKEQDEDKNLIYLTIRLREDDQLLGFVRLYWVEWTIGSGFLQLGIGEAKNRSKGYGTEALHMMMRYAFGELNLHRLSAVTADYNHAALGLFKKAGFVEEVRRRQAIQRDGLRWDAIHLGLLHDEWRVNVQARENSHG